jgi:hypothetical protein
MTGHPPSYTTELAERILQEVRSRRGLDAICAEPGMPSPTTVRNWIASDIDGFAARYEEARAAGGPFGKYRALYTRELSDRITGELAAGKHAAELCREPGMPIEETVQKWAAEDRDGFRERYHQALEAGRAVRGGPLPYSRELADRVLNRLLERVSLVAVCREPGMPSISTVLGWVRKDYDGFAARYREAREIGCQIMVDELITIGDDLAGDTQRTPGGATTPPVSREAVDAARLRCENRRWILSKALPRVFGDRIRLDAGDGWDAMLKQIDGQSLGLPNGDNAADE